jgi:hypothetical protein
MSRPLSAGESFDGIDFVALAADDRIARVG